MNQVQEQNPQCKKDSGMCSKESTLKLALGCWISAKMWEVTASNITMSTYQQYSTIIHKNERHLSQAVSSSVTATMKRARTKTGATSFEWGPWQTYMEMSENDLYHTSKWCFAIGIPGYPNSWMVYNGNSNWGVDDLDLQMDILRGNAFSKFWDCVLMSLMIRWGMLQLPVCCISPKKILFHSNQWRTLPKNSDCIS